MPTRNPYGMRHLKLRPIDKQLGQVGVAGKRATSLLGMQVLICGGSSGIGKALAVQLVQLGANVCVVARDVQRLQQAAQEIELNLVHVGQSVRALQLDCSDAQQVEHLINVEVQSQGVPDWLINCVGVARPDYVENLSAEDYRLAIESNYYAQLYPTLSLLPHLRRAGRGHIAFVSSMMGYFGIVGFSAYAPAKFALAGLAHVLQNELAPEGIRVSILFPPDTDTPGFAAENVNKPAETAAMSEAAGCLSAEQVAQALIHGMRRGQFAIYPGQARWVSYAQRFFPGLLRRYLARMHLRVRRRS